MIDKEKVYDEQISPLMATILEVCRENKLAMVASFDLGSLDQPGMTCVSALVGPGYDAPKLFRDVVAMLLGEARLFEFTISGDA